MARHWAQILTYSRQRTKCAHADYHNVARRAPPVCTRRLLSPGILHQVVPREALPTDHSKKNRRKLLAYTEVVITDGMVVSRRQSGAARPLRAPSGRHQRAPAYLEEGAVMQALLTSHDWLRGARLATWLRAGDSNTALALRRLRDGGCLYLVA